MASKRNEGKRTGATSRDGTSAKRSRPDPLAVLASLGSPSFGTIFHPEPQLVFGDGKLESDPKTGLALHKPFDLNLSGRKSTIRLGVVGTGEMVDAVAHWLDRCTRPVQPIRKKRKDGKIVSKSMDAIAYPPFPGLATAFEAEFVIGDNMTVELTEFEVAGVLKLDYFEQRVTKLVALVAEKVRVLAEGMQAPDVVIVALPADVRKKCTIPKHNRTRQTTWTLAHALKAALAKDEASGQGRLFDLSAAEVTKVAALSEEEEEKAAEVGVFHHGLKAAVMPHGVPVQLVWSATLEGGPTVEDDATRAWNFWTGIYYKSGGIPWRVSGLERGTCYVGVAFYRSKKDDALHTTMAQAFSDKGEGIVLRGGPFQWDTEHASKTPHMPAALAKELMTNVIAAYGRVHGQSPTRVVVHKWQRYFEDERRGIEEALSDAKIRSYDLVAFGDRDIRFFRAGAEPVLRGTQVSLTPDNVLLYTRGYVPYVSEYSGMRVPRPVELVEHFGSASKKRLCEEILALTKLDWNSAVFAQKEPITTAFSQDVGQVLSEVSSDGDPKALYRFYM